MKMQKKLGAIILAGVLVLAEGIPMIAMAGQGKGKGGGQGSGAQIRNTQQQVKDRQRLRDGSCSESSQMRTGASERRGNTYGPGDGTGNEGIGPKDGTGYGAPSQR